jgi:hypothetical protein
MDNYITIPAIDGPCEGDRVSIDLSIVKNHDTVELRKIRPLKPIRIDGNTTMKEAFPDFFDVNKLCGAYDTFRYHADLDMGYLTYEGD